MPSPRYGVPGSRGVDESNCVRFREVHPHWVVQQVRLLRVRPRSSMLSCRSPWWARGVLRAGCVVSWLKWRDRGLVRPSIRLFPSRESIWYGFRRVAEPYPRYPIRSMKR